MVVAGRVPGFSATIFSARVSATEVLGSSEVIVVAGCSNAEYFGVARLDRIALFFHRGRIILHGLDVLERPPPGLLLGLRMHRPQATNIDDQLLGVPAKAERLKQFRSIGIR